LVKEKEGPSRKWKWKQKREKNLKKTLDTGEASLAVTGRFLPFHKVAREKDQ